MVSEDKELDMMVDIVIPTSVIAGLFLINVLVVLLIRKRRKLLEYSSIESPTATKTSSIAITEESSGKCQEEIQVTSSYNNPSINGTSNDAIINIPTAVQGCLSSAAISGDGALQRCYHDDEGDEDNAVEMDRL